MHFIIFLESPGRGWVKLQCYQSGGKEPGRGLAQEWRALPGKKESYLLSKWMTISFGVPGAPADAVFPSLVCTQISCASPSCCRTSVDGLLALPSCHLASLTQLSLAEAEILMYCLNLEVTFSPSFVSRTNESLQCNFFRSLFMEFDLNFRTDKDDVLTGQAARIISPSLLCQCIMLLPNIFSKSFLSTALNSLSTQGLFSWDSLCIALRKHLHALLPFLFRTYREI